jgi:hypothetical protein
MQEQEQEAQVPGGGQGEENVVYSDQPGPTPGVDTIDNTDDIDSEDDELDAEFAANGDNPDNAISVLEQLREQREELKTGEHRLDLDIPGYNGMLVARYKPLRWSIIEALTKKVRKDKSGVSKNVLASTDTLIEACEEIFLRVNGELTSIPTGAGLPVKFDTRLAEALSFEAATVREVVAGVFPNEMGVIEHNVMYSRWLRDVTKEVDEDLLGE